jgi:hypothetical protein
MNDVRDSTDRRGGLGAVPGRTSMTTEDFTTLPEGFIVVLEGTIARCPHCGRNGVVKRPDEGTPYCIHIEESTLLCDGMLTEPTDLCDLLDA